MCYNSESGASTVIDTFKTRFDVTLESSSKLVLEFSMKNDKNFVTLYKAPMTERLFKRFHVERYEIYGSRSQPKQKLAPETFEHLKANIS